MKFTGNVWKFGDDMDTGSDHSGALSQHIDPNVLDGHCMEDADPDFVGKVRRVTLSSPGKFWLRFFPRTRPHRYQSGRDILGDCKELCPYLL